MKSTQSEAVLELKEVTFRYPGAMNTVIDGLSLSLQRGSRIGITGPNGSGKTTLFFLIMGLLKPVAGTMHAFGQAVSKPSDFEAVRRRVGLLFQDADDQLFCPTVLEDVAFGPLNLGKKTEEAIDIAHDTLHLLGLDGFENRVTHRLSGGEKRLVALATVLAMKPEILLLDEPSNGLDERTKQRLIDHLSELNLTYLIISHDNEFLSAMDGNNYTMKEGKLSEIGHLHAHYHSHPHKLSHQHSHLHRHNGKADGE